MKYLADEQEFIALVKASDKRLELWDGEVFDMSYTSPAHQDIVGNLAGLLAKRLKPPCAARTGVPIRPPNTTGVFREPDLVVLCAERKIEFVGGLQLTTNPSVIIEVVSPNTEAVDRNQKVDEYRDIASLREYLIVAQKSASINQWTRQGSLWRETATAGLSTSITIMPSKIILPLKEIYRGVKFR